MQKIYFFLVLLFVTVSTQHGRAQSNDIVLYKKIVGQALKVNDFSSAIMAAHHIIAIDGTNSVWQDSLVLMYFQSQNYLSSHLLATQLLRERKDSPILLEISAVSLSSLGALKDAIAAYERLYPLTKDAKHAYLLADLQYRIKRLNEAEYTLSQLLAAEIPSSASVVHATPSGGQQSVSLKAAVQNLRGLVAFDLKQMDQATAYFSKAVEVSPNFEAAKQNILAIAATKNNKPGAAIGTTPKK